MHTHTIENCVLTYHQVHCRLLQYLQYLYIESTPTLLNYCVQLKTLNLASLNSPPTHYINEVILAHAKQHVVFVVHTIVEISTNSY